MDFFSPPPTPPNSGNPGTFNDDADAFLGWFPAFVAELNALLPYLTGAGFGDGTAAAPGLVWKGDPDTGLFRPGSNALGIAAGGILRLTVSALALTSTVPLRAPLGTAAAPGISFETDPNTGIRSDGADVLHFITGGATRGFFSTTHFQSTLPAVVPVGAAATPALTFAGDLDTGIFRAAADLLGIATGGEERFRIGSGRAASLVPFSVPDGTPTFPGLTFNGEVGSNTGFFLAAENELGVSCQGDGTGAVHALRHAAAGAHDRHGRDPERSRHHARAPPEGRGLRPRRHGAPDPGQRCGPDRGDGLLSGHKRHAEPSGRHERRHPAAYPARSEPGGSDRLSADRQRHRALVPVQGYHLGRLVPHLRSAQYRGRRQLGLRLFRAEASSRRARRLAPNMSALRMGRSFAAWSRPAFRVRPRRMGRSIAPNGRR